MVETDAYFDINKFDFALFDYPLPLPSEVVPTLLLVTSDELNVSTVISAEG